MKAWLRVTFSLATFIIFCHLSFFQKSPIPHNRFDSLEFHSDSYQSGGNFGIRGSSLRKFFKFFLTFSRPSFSSVSRYDSEILSPSIQPLALFHLILSSLIFLSHLNLSSLIFSSPFPNSGRFRDTSYENRKRAVALFNFYTSNPKELSFEKGSIIYINRSEMV